MSVLEEELHRQLVGTDLPRAGREVVFAGPRRWRLDFAWGAHMIAVEVEGIGGAKSRHRTWTGFTKDCEKYNEAALRGWMVLRFTGAQVKDGTALATIKRAFEGIR